jgi:antitoxin component of RelBE/YafQ-DinJ toxin-antitoxin module
MTIKTFNVDEEVYEKFLQFCKENGISMSKQIEIFMKSRVEEKEEVREEYLQKLEEIRRGKFIRIDDFSKRYGL